MNEKRAFDCETCHDTGEVEAITQHLGPDDYTESIACPDCMIFLCGPSKCKHDYSRYEAIIEDGKVRSETAICSKCGASAIAEAAWL
jgi:ribosomal protein S27AE